MRYKFFSYLVKSKSLLECILLLLIEFLFIFIFRSRQAGIVSNVLSAVSSTPAKNLSAASLTPVNSFLAVPLTPAIILGFLDISDRYQRHR